MDTFEFNKIAGALLGTVLLFFGVSIVSDTLFHTGAPESPGYLIEIQEAATDVAATEEEPVSIAMLMQDASADDGTSVAKKCLACHSFEEGGANKVGPNLWNIVNQPIAASDDFAYSDALAALGSEGAVWGYEQLNGFLAAPKKWAPGTNMAFAGLRKEGDRADMIMYLRMQSSEPAPLPEPEAPQQDAAMDTTAAETDTASADVDTQEESAAMATDSTDESAAAEAETAAADDTGTDDATPQPAESTQAAAASDTDQSATGQAAAGDTAESTEMASTATEAPAASGDLPPAVALVASADPAAGEKVAKKCVACHSFNEGGKNKIGPALWGIVNKPIASVDGFKYSDAMVAHAEGGATWTYEALDAYLLSPRKNVPKTKMAFAGVKKDEDRAALLAYMRTLAAEPAPLP